MKKVILLEEKEYEAMKRDEKLLVEILYVTEMYVEEEPEKVIKYLRKLVGVK